ncbi:unnamed protein product [Caenorhabditis brenneri]
MTETSELTIYEKAFVKSDKTDTILVVDGKKLHVKRRFFLITPPASQHFSIRIQKEWRKSKLGI